MAADNVLSAFVPKTANPLLSIVEMNAVPAALGYQQCGSHPTSSLPMGSMTPSLLVAPLSTSQPPSLQLCTVSLIA